MWLQVATRRLGVTTSYARYVASLQHATVTVLLAKCLILAAEKGAANGDVNFLEDSQARCASVLRGVARTVGVHKRNEGGRPGSARGLLGGLGGLLKSSLWGEENWKLQKELLPVCVLCPAPLMHALEACAVMLVFGPVWRFCKRHRVRGSAFECLQSCYCLRCISSML